MRYRDTLCASVVALAFGGVAHAEPAKAPADGLGEIVVTAQRRAESAQDVPIAVTAYNADQLSKSGVATASDLAQLIPGVTINPVGPRSPLFVRGVGNNGTSTSPSVLTFVDGVYQPFDNTAATEFSNVQSIELAKGPQGTLFGRNATGGVLQITTRNPLDWQGVDAEFGYGNYDTVAFKVYASAKLADGVAADIAGSYNNQNHGWGKNLFDGSEFYTAKRYGARSKLVADIDDTFKATLVLDYSNHKGQIGSGFSRAVNIPFIFDFGAGQKLFLPTIYDVDNDTPAGWKSKEGGVALTLDKRLGEIRLLSISSYRRNKEHLLLDGDGGPSFFFTLDRDDRRQVATQEFQASGSSDRFKWVAGLYYYYALDHINGPNFGGPFASIAFSTPPGVPLTLRSVDTTNAYAAYAQGTMRVLPATNLTLGARYTIERREISGAPAGSTNPIFNPGPGSEHKVFRQPNYRVALDHKFTPNILGYFSFSHGFNAGFFSQQSIVGFDASMNPAVEPEKIDAYEIGLKSDLLDHRLRINLAAFLYDYTNLQQQIYINATITSINAAASRIKGIDFDIAARPVRNLTLSLGGTYLDSVYNSYPLAPDYVLFPNGAVLAVGAKDAKGKKLVLTPELSVQFSATYTLRTRIGTFDTTADLNYQSKTYNDPQNAFEIPSRTLLGLTERWMSSDEKTRVLLWVKNLTNKVYETSFGIVTPMGVLSQPGAPRSYGFTVGRRF